MALVWNPVALLGFAFVLFALALAVLSWRTGRANRALSVFLVLYAATFGTRFALRPLLDDLPSAYAAQVLYAAGLLGGLPIYLLIVRRLRTRWTEALQGPIATTIIVILAVAGPLLVLSFPERFVLIDPARPAHAFTPGGGIEDGPWMDAVFVAVIPLLIYTLLAAIAAVVGSPPGSLARSRAVGYVAAFATHDLLWAVHTFATTVWPRPAIGTALREVFIYGSIVIPLIFASLLAYAALRWQVFDIDLKIKRGIARGTLVAIFLVVFVLVAEVVQNWLSETQGYLMGGAAAAALVLLIRPLERAADRFANAAMPGVTGSPEYVAYRKLQVYRATLEGAREDGAITHKERAMLDALARELGIRPEDARAVEAEVRRAPG